MGIPTCRTLGLCGSFRLSRPRDPEGSGRGAQQPASSGLGTPRPPAGSRWGRGLPTTRVAPPGHPHVPWVPPRCPRRRARARPGAHAAPLRLSRAARPMPRRGPGPARGREERGAGRERAHTPPPPPEPARGARGQGGADRPSHSPGLRAATSCRRPCRRVRPSAPGPRAPGLAERR